MMPKHIKTGLLLFLIVCMIQVSYGGENASYNFTSFKRGFSILISNNNIYVSKIQEKKGVWEPVSVKKYPIIVPSQVLWSSFKKENGQPDLGMWSYNLIKQNAPLIYLNREGVRLLSQFLLANKVEVIVNG